MDIIYKFIKVQLFVTFLIILISSCSDNDNNPVESEESGRGVVINTENTANVTTEGIQLLVNSIATSAPITLKYDVQVYSIDYYTIDAKNNEQIASGALFVPKGQTNMPLVSIQHGTETKSNAVASVNYLNSFEGVGGLVFASLGYLTVVPDYLGFGVSNVDHPYMHANSLTPCIVDFIRAAKNFSTRKEIVLNEDVFLAGYSEGGYLTLAAQKDIELNYTSEINLKAIAPMAGPYDFKGTVDSILVDGEYSTPYYVAYVLKSYDEIYAWNRLNDFFQSPYNTTVSSLLNGSKEYDVVVSQLPSTLKELLKNEFISNYNNGKETELENVLDENSLLNWTPTTPIHFFHGNADEVVPYDNALKAVAEFSSKGADVKLTTIFGGTHSTSVTSSMIGAIEWFETF